MGFLKEILDEKIIQWDDKRYTNWKTRSDRTKNAALLTRLPRMSVLWNSPDYDLQGGTGDRVPNYPDEVMDWIEQFDDLNLASEEYGNAYDRLYGKYIPSMTLTEALDLLTWYVRTERVLPGTMAEGLQNGDLEKLTDRIHELTHPKES